MSIVSWHEYEYEYEYSRGSAAERPRDVPQYFETLLT